MSGRRPADAWDTQSTRTPADAALGLWQELSGWARRSGSAARDDYYELVDRTRESVERLRRGYGALASATRSGAEARAAAKSLVQRGAKTAVERWYTAIQMPNQGWSMLWIIDYVCTLKCVYCGNADVTISSTNADSRKAALDIICTKQPGYLTISGGEPVLIPDLEELLAELARRVPNMAITLNSSLIVKDVDIYQRLIPFLKTLYISLDGAGETNKAQRGVSGDLVLKRIRYLFPHAKRHGVNVFVNAVITIHNYDKLVELFEALDAISPEISLGFAPIVPFDDPLSIFGDPDKLEVFYRQYNQLRERHGEARVQLNGYPKSSVHCYSQYLDAFVYPEGHLKSCAEKKFSHDFDLPFFLNYVRKNWNTDYVNIAKFAASFALRKPSAICFQPCNTSARVNQIIYEDRDYQRALFAPATSPSDVLAGSFSFFKYDLMRRKLVDKFFTADSAAWFFEGTHAQELAEFMGGYDYHEVLYVQNLPVGRVRYRVVDQGRLHMTVKPYFRAGRRVFDRFPIYTLVNVGGAWKIKLDALLPERKKEPEKVRLALVAG
ncbi:MAG: radical SAM protein [Polyangiaceae bacterium]